MLEEAGFPSKAISVKSDPSGPQADELLEEIPAPQQRPLVHSAVMGRNRSET